jgi:hypothetical protein
LDSVDLDKVQGLVALGERLSDEIAEEEELNAARCDTTRLPRNLHHSVCGLGTYTTFAADDTLNEVAFDAAFAASVCVHLGFGLLHGKESFDTGPAYDFDVDPPLLRDIFGNPFCPVSFSPEWRTDTALSLAKQMYESREFGEMPILADALQDAGCDTDDILSHCRDTSLRHFRGCWAVDLVLGKE